MSLLDVSHYLLNPADREPNKWASLCPACKVGTLGVVRDPQTYVLREYDCCLRCGQQVRYLDIEEMRRRDWAGKDGAP